MECSRCSSGYIDQQHQQCNNSNHLTSDDYNATTPMMPMGNDLDEVRKRFVTFEQRVEALEKNMADRVDAKMLALKIQRKREAMNMKWKAALADSTTIHGLKEVLTENHRVLRPTWFFIFIAAVGSTAYYINKVVSEYANDPTATKVRIMRQEEYNYPIMLLCPDTWLDADKAFALNLSEPGLEYALGFIINFGVHKAPYTIKNYKQARQDFESWWYTGAGARFRTLAELFKHIAIDSDVFVTNCSYCPDVHLRGPPAPFAKVIMNEGVCYNLSLAPTDGRVSLSDLEYLHVKMPMLSKGYLAQRSYWRYIVNPDLNLGMSDTHYLQVFPNHSNTIRVMPHHFKSLPNSYCVTLEEVRSLNYSQSTCVANCFMETRPNGTCRAYPFIRSDQIPKNVSNICNTAQWVSPDFVAEKPLDHQSNGGASSNGEAPAEAETQIVATPMICIEQCPSLCEKWVYENSVEAHKLNPQDDEDDGVTSFHFLNQVAHYGGILSHEEVPTYSFETLVSNVGGQLGLWLGASLMSLIELVMFLLNVCCDGRKKRKMQRAAAMD